MKYILLLTLSLSLSLCEKVYKCGDDLKLDTCYISQASSDKTTTTYYLSACSKGKYCQEDGLDVSYSICIKRKNNLEIGDKCLIGNECITGTCTEGKCVGSKEGNQCNTDSNCDIGLYCETISNKNVCTKYVDAGGSCTGSDTYRPCKAGYVCANNQCTLQFSIENGSASTNPFACKSKFSYGGKCAEVVSVSQWLMDSRVQ